ncbi:MAG TPA: 5'-methylthioadenosine/S-adenosylhomocysteine nucleosidase [Candidatus Deferrimicrobium sp.]|nr:5'-methylthioadenosine/S-adenosylhomocysteine nucleosidase [Candidatus Deferrimicrobium sp.]
MFAVVLGLLLSLSAWADTQSSPHLILYAFDAEGQLLSRQMTVQRTEKHLGRTVLVGQLSGKDVVLAESGVGTTNAAMTLQRMIDVYHPQAVIFTGIAGAIDSSVHIGDIVVCREWIQHDYGYIGSVGFEPRGVNVYSPRPDSLVRMSHFEADTALLRLAIAVRDGGLEFKSVGNRAPVFQVGGVGVSGNTFIDSREKREWLSTTFHALITDMESAAVAQVCVVNDLPFIVVRSASDLAGGSDSETAKEELEAFFAVAAENSARVVTALLR